MLLAEIGVYLAAQSVSAPFTATLVRATNLFEGVLPASPASCVALIEYPGGAPEHTLGGQATRLEFARFQVNVRHALYATGRALCQEIAAALVKIGAPAATLTGCRYLSVMALQSGPTPMPMTEAGQWHWTWNFEATKEPS